MAVRPAAGEATLPVRVHLAEAEPLPSPEEERHFCLPRGEGTYLLRVESVAEGRYALEVRRDDFLSTMIRRNDVAATPGADQRYVIEVRPRTHPVLALVRVEPPEPRRPPVRPLPMQRLVVFVSDAGGTTRPPVFALLEDEDGRRAGQGSTGALHQEIPGARAYYRAEAVVVESVELYEAVDVEDIFPGAYVLHLYGTHAGTYLLRVRSGPHAEHVEDRAPRTVAEGEWHRYGLLVLPAGGVIFFDPATGP